VPEKFWNPKHFNKGFGSGFNDSWIQGFDDQKCKKIAAEKN
jgi:hypothetical protein